MSSALPSFAADPQSPALDATPSTVALAAQKAGARQWTAHATYRVATGDRGLFGHDPIREQLWLVLIDRATLAWWAARPGAGATVFEGDEPTGKPIEGFINVDLYECLGLDPGSVGSFDLIAVLGPLKSKALEIRLGT